MPRHARLDVYRALLDTGLLPVFYHAETEVVLEVARACAAGGAKLFELTNRGDMAWQTFVALERFCVQEKLALITGVGTIIDPETAALYVNCGANFVVGPSLSPEVAKFCNRRKIAYIPGCGTATEISLAEELGAEIVKVFPGDALGGPDFVRAVRGPSPWSSLMPTGGIDISRESLSGWFSSGIVAAGIGSTLISPALVKAGDYAGITNQVRQTLETIRSVRGK